MLLSQKNCQPKHFVAIDIGSNSVHVVVIREDNSQTKIIHKQKESIRLLSGLDENNILNQNTIMRALNCLKQFKAGFEHLPNCQVAIVATYALREAKNSQEFLEQAANIMPYQINIISGEREAELIFLGVAYTKNITQPTLIIDIGGGSTEFIVGSELTPQKLQSLPIGCVSFTQQFFATGYIDTKAMLAAYTQAKAIILRLSEQYNALGWQNTLGTSGSIKAVSKIMLELYGDKKINQERLQHLQAQLISWGHHDKIFLESLSNKRRPLLAAAVAILLACFDLLHINQMKYNSGGVREGLLYQLKLESK